MGYHHTRCKTEEKITILLVDKEAIADVANSKRHQRLDEIAIIFTRTIQEISKVVCNKTMSETRAFITSKMLYETRTL